MSSHAMAGLMGGNRNNTFEAVAQLQPAPGQTASGVAHLSASQDGSSSARVIALLLPAVQKVRIGLGDIECDRLQSGGYGEYLNEFGPRIAVSPNGTASLDVADAFRPSELRRARSTVIVGDFDGDGGRDLLACGDLTKRIIADPRPRDTLVYSSFLGSDEYFRPSFLVYGGGDGNDKVDITGALIGLQPNTDHGVAFSSEGCRRPADDVIDVVVVFRTDAQGRALISGQGLPFAHPTPGDNGSTERALTVVSGTNTWTGADIVACAPLHVGFANTIPDDAPGRPAD